MNSLAIDINQRIPLEVLEASLMASLLNEYTHQYVEEQLRMSFEGANRIKKAIRIVDKIVVRNPLADFLFENKIATQNSIKSKSDKNIILISLLNTAFPFSFEVLRAFGKYFQIQDVISSSLIKRTISSKYGSNRSTENGLYCVIPMFLEAGFFARSKTGLYTSSSMHHMASKLSVQAYQKSFIFNTNRHFAEGINEFEPYFHFVQLR